MADIGLYTLKYPFRKLIGSLVPLCREISPNAISVLLVPIGALTAFVYWIAPGSMASLYLAGLGLIFLRMIVATLDGLVAVTYGKSTPYGEMVNRICPEICDWMLLAALLLASPHEPWLLVSALVFAWATSFFGLIGLTGQRPIQSVGPVGQTDRLAALMLFSLLQYLSIRLGWQIDFMRIFLLWLLVGGVPTLGLRAYRSLR